MSSLIRQVSYSLSSSPASSGHPATDAFSTSTAYFETLTSPYFWQISFSKPVTITSYTIGGSSKWGCTITSWGISYSVDGSTFTTLQTNSASSLIGQKLTYQLNRQINCNHFRITGKASTCGSVLLGFNQFDCYGTVGLVTPKRTPSLTPKRTPDLTPRSTRIQYTCNVAVIRNKLISQALLVLMTLILSS
jgi:hypothetical protein